MWELQRTRWWIVRWNFNLNKSKVMNRAEKESELLNSGGWAQGCLLPLRNWIQVLFHLWKSYLWLSSGWMLNKQNVLYQHRAGCFHFFGMISPNEKMILEIYLSWKEVLGKKYLQKGTWYERGIQCYTWGEKWQNKSNHTLWIEEWSITTFQV